jgi:hypothetical protein
VPKGRPVSLLRGLCAMNFRGEAPMRDHDCLQARFREVLAESYAEPTESERYVRLMVLLALQAPPPDPFGLYPRYGELHDRFLQLACSTVAKGAAVEQSFLALYCHLHGYEVPYTAEERRCVRETGGYLSHCGGIAPIVKAGPWIGPETVSGDFGAGNGLQGLLMQVLYPHACTVQIEISSRMVQAGQVLQRWLGIEPDRVRWVVGDILDASPAGMDFVYLYRPVRPVGRGRNFYEHFGRELSRHRKPAVIFSIADCLGPFLPAGFDVFYGDGHLTCYRRR